MTMNLPRRPAVWLASAVIALALLASVAWQRKHIPQGSVSFLSGDPVSGGMLFESKRCSHCHAINGSGGKLAPDLGAGRNTSRANLGQLVTTMWNHAPEMWKRMQQENLRAAPMSQSEVSDLFAFLYLARYLDEAGDAGNGHHLFESKGCIRCHAIRGEGGKLGPDLANINGVDTPIQWTQTLWNHAPAMEKQFSTTGMSWPRFNKSEMSDMLAYVREVSTSPRSEFRLLPADPVRGWQLFKSKSCIECHAVQGQGGHVGPDLGVGRQSPMTMVEFAGAMWNHSPQMYREMTSHGIQRPTFNGQEMADLMAFFNSLRYFEPNGSVEAGRGVFASRGCSRCHGTNAQGTSLGPALRARRVNSVSLATALWRHGPEMYRRTQSLGIAWPKLDENDLGDLFAFLNSPPEEGRR